MNNFFAQWFPWSWIFVTKPFFEVTVTATDGDVIDRKTTVGVKADETVEQTPQFELIELVQQGNNKNFDKADFKEAESLLEDLVNDIAHAPENIPTTAPTNIIFSGWRHSS